MKVNIQNIPQSLCTDEPFEAYSVSTDPDNRYAVVEAFSNCLFIAVKIVSRDDDLLVGEYVNHYEFHNGVLGLDPLRLVQAGSVGTRNGGSLRRLFFQNGRALLF